MKPSDMQNTKKSDTSTGDSKRNRVRRGQAGERNRGQGNPHESLGRNSSAAVESSIAFDGSNVDGSRVVEATKKLEGTEQDTSSEPCCPICTEPLISYAVGVCNHHVCHRCALRMRVLYRSNDCVLCKTRQDEIVISNQEQRPFTDFQPLSSLPYYDQSLTAYFTDKAVYECSVSLLKYACPLRDCGFVVQDPRAGWAALKTHTRKKHGLMFCEICVDHKKVFSVEHFLYQPSTLQTHINRGDKFIKETIPTFSARITRIRSNHGEYSANASHAMRGHPKCNFCRTRFYEDDHLYEHCRHNHEECFLCQRQGHRNVYYKDYQSLENHFRDVHYLCEHHDCLDKKFVVFGNQLELKAHEIEAHQGRRLPRSKQMLSRRVEIHPIDGLRGTTRSEGSGRRESAMTSQGGAADAPRSAEYGTSQVFSTSERQNDRTIASDNHFVGSSSGGRVGPLTPMGLARASSSFGGRLSVTPDSQVEWPSSSSISPNRAAANPFSDRLWDYVGQDPGRIQESRDHKRSYCQGEISAYEFWSKLSALYPVTPADSTRATAQSDSAAKKPFEPAWGTSKPPRTSVNPGLSALETSGLIGMMIKTCPLQKQADLKRGYHEFKLKAEHYPELPSASSSASCAKHAKGRPTTSGDTSAAVIARRLTGSGPILPATSRTSSPSKIGRQTSDASGSMHSRLDLSASVGNIPVSASSKTKRLGESGYGPPVVPLGHSKLNVVQAPATRSSPSSSTTSRVSQPGYRGGLDHNDFPSLSGSRGTRAAGSNSGRVSSAPMAWESGAAAPECAAGRGHPVQQQGGLRNSSAAGEGTNRDRRRKGKQKINLLLT